MEKRNTSVCIGHDFFYALYGYSTRDEDKCYYRLLCTVITAILIPDVNTEKQGKFRLIN